MTDDVRKLLGGYATGTLSSEEREQLFEAALHDDQLFAALSDEQALKDLLDDSAVRAQLLRATEEPRFSVLAAFREWFESPKSKALAATGAVVLVLIGFKELGPTFTPHPQEQVAEVRPSLAIRGPAEAPLATAPPESEPAAVRAKPPRQREQPSQEQPALSALKKERDLIITASEPIPTQQSADQVAQSIVSPPPLPSPAPPTKEAVTVDTGVMAGYRAGQEIRASSRQMRLADSVRPMAASGPAAAPSLRYELLRRDADGEFRVVPNQHEFAPGDVVRVRVTSREAGAVAVSIQDQETRAAQIRANESASIPANGGIAITANTGKLVLAFAPSGMVSNSLAEREESKAKQASPPGVTIEIPIRVRRP